MKYHVLLADADGTLFDFLAGEKAALRTVLEGMGLPVDEETVQLYSHINESHWKKLERGETTQERLRVERFSEFLQAIQKEGDPRAMAAAYVQQLGQQRILIAGAEAFCRVVSARMPIFLVTNGLSGVQRSRFAGCALAPFLSGFEISEETGHSKPEPHMLFAAMKRAGVADPRRAVMLGDSVTADIGAAKNAGVDSILFTNGKEPPKGHGATYAARTLEEAQRMILEEEGA